VKGRADAVIFDGSNVQMMTVEVKNLEDDLSKSHIAQAASQVANAEAKFHHLTNVHPNRIGGFLTSGRQWQYITAHFSEGKLIWCHTEIISTIKNGLVDEAACHDVSLLLSNAFATASELSAIVNSRIEALGADAGGAGGGSKRGGGGGRGGSGGSPKKGGGSPKKGGGNPKKGGGSPKKGSGSPKKGGVGGGGGSGSLKKGGGGRGNHRGTGSTRGGGRADIGDGGVVSKVGEAIRTRERAKPLRDLSLNISNSNQSAPLTMRNVFIKASMPAFTPFDKFKMERSF
jgi:hypothetical protein